MPGYGGHRRSGDGRHAHVVGAVKRLRIPVARATVAEEFPQSPPWGHARCFGCEKTTQWGGHCVAFCGICGYAFRGHGGCLAGVKAARDLHEDTCRARVGGEVLLCE